MCVKLHTVSQRSLSRSIWKKSSHMKFFTLTPWLMWLTIIRYAVVPKCRSIFGIQWRCKWHNQLENDSLWSQHMQSTTFFDVDQRPLHWVVSNGQVNQDGGHAVKCFPPAQTLYCHNWHKRAGGMERILVHWGKNFGPIQFLGTNLSLGTWIKHRKPQET